MGFDCADYYFFAAAADAYHIDLGLEESCEERVDVVGELSPVDR